MSEWIMNNAATIIICAALAAAVVLIVVNMRINKKQGKSVCSCPGSSGCSGCPMANACGSADTKNK